MPVRSGLRPQVTLCRELMNDLDGITSLLVALQLRSLCLLLSLLSDTAIHLQYGITELPPGLSHCFV